MTDDDIKKARVANYLREISSMSPADALEHIRVAFDGGWITHEEYVELLNAPIQRSGPSVNSRGGVA